MDRMTLREERRMLSGVLLMALALIGLVMLFASGCATLRKTVLSTAKATRVTAEVTRDVCRELAASWCKTNPCPELDRCHTAEAAFVRAAQALVAGGEAVNKLPREVLDARR